MRILLATDSFIVVTSLTENFRPSPLSIKELSQISFTEAPADFGLAAEGGKTSDPGVSKEKIWQDAIDFQWDLCLSLERAGASNWSRCSFLICHSGGEGSGYTRKKEVRQSIAEASVSVMKSEEGDDSNASSDENQVVLKTVYNKESKWCGLARLDATLAERLKCSGNDDIHCQVTPEIFSMKLISGSVEKIQMDIKKYYEFFESISDDQKNDRVHFPMVEIELCPGVISQEDVENLTTELANRTKLNNAMTVEAAEYVKDWLLKREKDRDGVTAFSSAVAKSMFWTTSSLKEEQTGTRRSFWRRIMELTLESDYCDATYSERLLWFGEFRNAEEFSSLLVTFNETSTVDLDVKCALALLVGIAVLPAVCSVEVPSQPSTLSTNAQWMTQSGGLPEERPWFDHGLDGSGQVVALADTGIDVDNCYFWDSSVGAIPALEPTSDHRKIVQYVPYINGDDVKYGHGTHVAGLIAGRRAIDGKNESTGAADGVAREAKLAFFDIGAGDGSIWVGPSLLMLETGRTGNGEDPPHAHVHSASWGSRGDNYYTFQSRNFDVYMHAFDDFLAVTAVGNDGDDGAENTVWSPSTFKNGIAVGASHSCCDDLADGQLGPSYIAPWSSRGPTQDGRLSPHVVAPGRYLLSSGALPKRVGECDEGIPSPGDARGGLQSLQGTSMAAPVVSATAALVRQYFVEGFYPEGQKGSGKALFPSGALVKAVLLNGAQTTNIKGVDNGQGNVAPVEPYDNTIGFGRIDLQKSLYIEGWSDVQAKVWDRESIGDGESIQYNVTIDQSNGCVFDQLSVTLVWMDDEVSLGCTQCVVGDLDLSIRKGEGQMFYPNGREVRDATNNVERIVIPGVKHADSFALTVFAFNLDNAMQQFALVATGCFGGVANNLNTSMNVFDSDDSADQLTQKLRKNRIIIITCSTLGAVVVLVAFYLLYRRSQKGDSSDGMCAKWKAVLCKRDGNVERSGRAEDSPKRAKSSHIDDQEASGATTLEPVCRG